MKQGALLTILALACVLTIPSVADARYRDGMNLYEYVGSGPVGRVDPAGTDYIKTNDEGHVWWIIEKGSWPYVDKRWVWLGTLRGNMVEIRMGFAKGVRPGKCWRRTPGSNFTVPLRSLKDYVDRYWDKYGRDLWMLPRRVQDGRIGLAVARVYGGDMITGSRSIGYAAAKGYMAGTKATVNSSYNTVVSTVTLGQAEGGEVWKVTEDDYRHGYGTSYVLVRIGNEFYVGVLTAGLGNVSKGGKAAQYTGRLVNVMDKAEAGVNLVQGGYTVIATEGEEGKLQTVLGAVGAGTHVLSHISASRRPLDSLDEIGEATTDAARGTSRAADNVADAAPKSGAVKEGIYEFPDAKAGGNPYVGQSGDVPSRLQRHQSAGRLTLGIQPKTSSVPGGRTAREIAEHRRIQEITGGVPARKSPNVANQRDPIGPNRRHLLDE